MNILFSYVNAPKTFRDRSGVHASFSSLSLSSVCALFESSDSFEACSSCAAICADESNDFFQRTQKREIYVKIFHARLPEIACLPKSFAPSPRFCLTFAELPLNRISRAGGRYEQNMARARCARDDVCADVS